MRTKLTARTRRIRTRRLTGSVLIAGTVAAVLICASSEPVRVLAALGLARERSRSSGRSEVVPACTSSRRTAAAFDVLRPTVRISAPMNGRPTGAASPTWTGEALFGACCPTVRNVSSCCSSTSELPGNLAWSPDGKAIAVLARDPAAGPANALACGSARGYCHSHRRGHAAPPPHGDVVAGPLPAMSVVRMVSARDETPTGGERPGLGHRGDGGDRHPLHIYRSGGGTWSRDGKLLGFIGGSRRDAPDRPLRRDLRRRRRRKQPSSRHGQRVQRVRVRVVSGREAFSTRRANRAGIYVIDADGR